MKNNQTQTVITALKRAAITHKRPLWKRIASDLEKPTRKRRIVNLWKIEKITKEGDKVIVPGKLLGDGVITKKVTVAPAWCSNEAKRKLSAVGAKIITINELLEQYPDGKDIKIIG